MPPTNHAARLRKMAETARQEADSYSQIARIRLSESSYKAIFEERREKYSADAAALLAGAEAIECLRDIMGSLPNKRDWLDPVTEARAKEVLRGQ